MYCKDVKHQLVAITTSTQWLTNHVGCGQRYKCAVTLHFLNSQPGAWYSDTASVEQFKTYSA